MSTRDDTTGEHVHRVLTGEPPMQRDATSLGTGTARQAAGRLSGAQPREAEFALPWTLPAGPRPPTWRQAELAKTIRSVGRHAEPEPEVGA